MSPEALVSRVLGISEYAVTDETSNTTLAEWDSMAHVTLVVEVESTYRVQLSTEDALAMISVAEIKRILSGRGVTW